MEYRHTKILNELSNRLSHLAIGGDDVSAAVELYGQVFEGRRMGRSSKRVMLAGCLFVVLRRDRNREVPIVMDDFEGFLFDQEWEKAVKHVVDVILLEQGWNLLPVSAHQYVYRFSVLLRLSFRFSKEIQNSFQILYEIPEIAIHSTKTSTFALTCVCMLVYSHRDSEHAPTHIPTHTLAQITQYVCENTQTHISTQTVTRKINVLCKALLPYAPPNTLPSLVPSLLRLILLRRTAHT